MQEETKKEGSAVEAVGGLAVASFVVGIVLLIIFIWAPASHFLGKWSDYWDDKDNGTVIHFDNSAYFDADDACEKATEEYLKTEKVFSYASSTKNGYEEYDCYGVGYTKIPVNNK